MRVSGSLDKTIRSDFQPGRPGKLKISLPAMGRTVTGVTFTVKGETPQATVKPLAARLRGIWEQARDTDDPFDRRSLESQFDFRLASKDQLKRGCRHVYGFAIRQRPIRKVSLTNPYRNDAIRLLIEVNSRDPTIEVCSVDGGCMFNGNSNGLEGIENFFNGLAGSETTPIHTACGDGRSMDDVNVGACSSEFGQVHVQGVVGLEKNDMVFLTELIQRVMGTATVLVLVFRDEHGMKSIPMRTIVQSATRRKNEG